MGRLRKLRKRLRKLLKRALKSRLKVVKTKTLLRPGKTFRLSAKCSSRMKQSPSKPRKKLSVKSLKNSTRRKRLPARRPLRRSSLLSSNSRMLALGSRKVGKPNQSWSWWKRASNQSAKADPKATTMEMQQHLGGVAEGPAQMLPQHPTRFDNVPVLTAEDIHMSSMDDDGEGYKLTLGDYCLLTAIALCIAYLIYKLYKACVARQEANENEEAMLAQAIELSQDPKFTKWSLVSASSPCLSSRLGSRR